MRTKLAVLISAMLLIMGASPLFAATQLKKLGASPFYKTKDLKEDQILPILKKMESDVKAGFIQAGAVNLYDPFMKALGTAKMEPVTIAPGESFIWMIFKKNKKPKVFNDVVWAGKEPFTAYRMTMRHGDKDYSFVFPVICLNIALQKITAVPVAAAAPPATAPAAAAPPAAAPAAIAATPPAAAPAAIAATPPAAAPAAIAAAPAAVAATAAAADTAPRKGHIIGDVGLMKLLDPATYLPIRVGYMHHFSEKHRLAGLVGFAPLIEGCEDNPAVLADALYFFYPTSRFFLGVGAGMWHTSFKTRADLLLEAGFMLTEKPTGPNFGIFVEGRSAFDEMDEFDDKGRVGFGLRVFF